GVRVISSVPGDGYDAYSGTSMASPAVSGVAALLRQVDANLDVGEMEEILISTATPLTDDDYPDTPNNGYGYGLIDAHNAVASIGDGLGIVEGSVQGEDNVAPTFSHEAPSSTYQGMDLELMVTANDNIGIATVQLTYQDNNGDSQT